VQQADTKKIANHSVSIIKSETSQDIAFKGSEASFEGVRFWE
jgi:hypothetical protein